MGSAYFLLAALGALLPFGAFVPWLIEHGLDPRAFLAELWSTRVGAFFGWDVVVAALALTTFIVAQGRRDGVRLLWLPIAATFCVGVSCGLPLFLALRERALTRNGAT